MSSFSFRRSAIIVSYLSSLRVEQFNHMILKLPFLIDAQLTDYIQNDFTLLFSAFHD
jgi:hypothetical protein